MIIDKNKMRFMLFQSMAKDAWLGFASKNSLLVGPKTYTNTHTWKKHHFCHNLSHILSEIQSYSVNVELLPTAQAKV